MSVTLELFATRVKLERLSNNIVAATVDQSHVIAASDRHDVSDRRNCGDEYNQATDESAFGFLFRLLFRGVHDGINSRIALQGCRTYEKFA